MNLNSQFIYNLIQYFRSKYGEENKKILLIIALVILIIITLMVYIYFKYRYTHSKVELHNFENTAEVKSDYVYDMLSTAELYGEKFQISFKVSDLDKDFALLSTSPFNSYGYKMNYVLAYKDGNVSFIQKTPIKDGSIFRFSIIDDDINGNMLTIGV